MKPSSTFADLQEGCPFAGVVWVIQSEAKTDKNGGEFLRFILGDSTQTRLSARYFSFPFADRDILLEAEWANVRGIQKFYNTSYLEISSLVPCAPPENIESYLPCSPVPIAELLDRLQIHIQSVRDPHLSRLLKCVFEEPQITDSFYRWPAAQSRHHAYCHGLLQHSLEVADVVSAVCTPQQNWGTVPLHRDLAVAGALLHDIGKIKEMCPEANTFTFSDAGELLGHVSLGIEKLRFCIQSVRRDCIDGFPRNLELELLHIIASHHGKGEWGAVVVPKTPEAELVHHADMISTRLFYFAEKTTGEKGGRFANQNKLSETNTARSIYIARYQSDTQSAGTEAVGVVQAELMEIADLLAQMSKLPVVRLLRDGGENRYAVSSRRLPVLGKSAAGEPLLDTAQEDGSLLVDWQSLSTDPRPHYLLRIDGESMTGDDIQNGDYVVVREQNTDEPGDISVVYLDGGATVKRIRRENGVVYLDSSNPNESPILVQDPAALKVQGCVVAVAR